MKKIFIGALAALMMLVFVPAPAQADQTCSGNCASLEHLPDSGYNKAMGYKCNDGRELTVASGENSARRCLDVVQIWVRTNEVWRCQLGSGAWYTFKSTRGWHSMGDVDRRCVVQRP